MTREYCLPFEVSMEPFYSDSNMKALEKSIRQLEEGKVHTFTWDEFEAMAREAENG